jgi:hypothetical protein
MITLNIFLILLASTSDAIMDTISSHFPTSVFSNSSDWKIVKSWSNARKLKVYKWLNPYYSWRNKWKNGNKEEGEAFLGSSTLFVFTTDAWHLMQFVQLNTLFIFAFNFYSFDKPLYINLITLALYRVLYGLWFTYLNDYKLIKKKLWIK